MASAYKLVYFDGRGAAESIRFILKQGGIEFEDIRIKREDWPVLKENSPFGQLPYIEYDGKAVNQSLAIARYFAKKAELAGKDDWEDLEIDAVVDTIIDFRNKMIAIHTEKNSEKKKTLFETAINETAPFYFNKFEQLVKHNNGYLAAKKLTWADLYFVSETLNYDFFFKKDILSKFPNLKSLVHKVNNLPAIKNWLENRPKTEF